MKDGRYLVVKKIVSIDHTYHDAEILHLKSGTVVEIKGENVETDDRVFPEMWINGYEDHLEWIGGNENGLSGSDRNDTVRNCI